MAFSDIVHRIMQMDQIFTEERDLIEFELGVENKPLNAPTEELIREHLPFETTLENYLAELPDDDLQKLRALMYLGRGDSTEWREPPPASKADAIKELLSADALPQSLGAGLGKIKAQNINLEADMRGT